MNKNQINREKLNMDYLIKVFRNNWLLISISLILALAAAWFINFTSVPLYKAQVSLLINDEGSESATANLLSEIGYISSTSNLVDEISVMQSTPIVRDAIRNLEFQVSYYEVGNMTKAELYKASPFIVIIDQNRPQPVNIPLYLKVNVNGDLRLYTSEKEVMLYSYFTQQKVDELPNLDININAKFNADIITNYMGIKILLNSQYDVSSLQNKTYAFVMHTETGLVKYYKQKILISQPDIESNIIDISLQGSVPQKNVDFLNALTSSYIDKGKTNKNHIAEKTIQYIDNQLDIVQDSLKLAEENLQRFRSGNNILDVSIQSSQLFDELKQLELQKSELLVNLKYFKYLQDYFAENNEYNDLIAPAGMGLQDNLLNNLIQELISLNAERVSFVENDQEKSPYLKKINIRIENLKNTITENIMHLSKTNELKLKDVDSRLQQLSRQMQKIPNTERQLLGIERKFNLNDEIYTYLLEKRSEAQIAKAAYQSGAEILEPAESEGLVWPNKGRNYLIAFFLGLVIPVTFIRIKDMVRTSFDDRENIMRNIHLPVVGQIYHNTRKVEAVLHTYPKTHISESFRKVRSSLSYFLSPDTSNVICITSTISQEGKSFVALNLATALASVENKTILIGFDLRKPRIYDRLGMKENVGLSDYLSKQAGMDDIIQETTIENLDAIWAGPPPPNSAELIESVLTEELIDKLREKYDYIIIDTAPIGIVSDGFTIMKHSDLKLYVTRTNRTPINESVTTVNELIENNTKNLGLIINDIPVSKKTRKGYGYYELDPSPKKSKA